MSRLTWKRSLRSFDSSWMETGCGRWPGGGGGADAGDAGGYAAAPLLRRDHAGSGGRLGSADGGAEAQAAAAAQTAAATPTQTP